jgi:hypothetical protein
MVSLARPRIVSSSLGALVVGGAVATAIFLIAYERGTFALTSRQGLAIGVLWALGLTALAAPWTLRCLRGLAAVPAIALLVLAVLSLASALWASSTQAALAEFDRCILYAAIYTLCVLSIRERHIPAWCNGIAWGTTGVGLVGLASRLAPNIISSGHAFDFLPIANIRLSYPIGYWNALGVFVALAIPLLLRSAMATRALLLRAVSMFPIPALSATIYLTSSRSGALAVLAGGVALVFLSSRRWAVLVAVLVAVAGSAVAVQALAVRRELTNGPLNSGTAVSQRGGAALQIALACVITAGVYAAAVYLWSRIGRPVSQIAERAAAVITVAAIVGAIIASHPLRQFHVFRSPLLLSSANPNYVQAHLLSASGNGRWQMWTETIGEFRAHPLLGTGAGSFEEWWMQHRPVALFVQNAHSLYLEMLGELGLIGFMVVLIVVAPAGIAILRIVRHGDSGVRGDGAAISASFLAFFVSAAFDWMWQVTAVTAVAFVTLALLMRLTARPEHKPTPQEVDAARSTAMRPEAAVATWIAGAIAIAGLLYAEAAPLLSARKLEASYSAVRHDNLQRAYKAALDGKDLTPWAAAPYLQLALVDEQRGRLDEASEWAKKAIDRDPNNWQLWLVATRLAVKEQRILVARRDLARATALNPLALGITSLR